MCVCVWLLQACTELCTRDLVRRTLGDEAHAVLLLLCGDIAHLQNVQDGHWHAVLHEHWYTLLHASLLYAKACVAYKRSGLSHLIARCYADTGGVVGEGKARQSVTHTHLGWPGQQLDQVGSPLFVSSDLAGRVVSCVLSSLAGNAAAPLRLLIELDQVWAAAHLADLLHHNKVRCCCSFLRFAAHHHVCAQHPIWPRRRWRCKSASQAGALASVSTCCWSWPRSSRHSPPCGSLPLAMQRMHSAPVARGWPTPSCTMLHLHQTGWRTSLQPCSAGTPKSTTIWHLPPSPVLTMLVHQLQVCKRCRSRVQSARHILAKAAQVWSSGAVVATSARFSAGWDVSIAAAQIVRQWRRCVA